MKKTLIFGLMLFALVSVSKTANAAPCSLATPGTFTASTLTYVGGLYTTGGTVSGSHDYYVYFKIARAPNAMIVIPYLNETTAKQKYNTLAAAYLAEKSVTASIVDSYGTGGTECSGDIW